MTESLLNDQPDDGMYACIYCNRVIEGELLDNGRFLFVHDSVPHPVDATFDEDEIPQ